MNALLKLYLLYLWCGISRWLTEPNFGFSMQYSQKCPTLTGYSEELEDAERHNDEV